MKSIQVKIGKVASGFALFITAIDLFAALTGLGFNNHSFIDSGLYFGYTIGFFITFLVLNNFTRILQLIMLFSIALYMAFNSSSFPAFIVLFVCISLLCAYGFYKNNRIIKLLLTVAVIFAIFILCPAHNHNIFVAISWTGLFFTFSLMMWYIFSDTIDKIKSDSHDERLLEEIKRSLIINERLIMLTKEMAEKLEGKSKNGRI